LILNGRKGTNKAGVLIQTTLAMVIGLLAGCAGSDESNAPSFLTSSVALAVDTQGMLANDAPAASGAVAPLCVTAGSDPDGDGWGWENQRTCQVAAETADVAGSADNLPVGIVYYLWHCATKAGGTQHRYRQAGLRNGEEFNITHVINGKQSEWGNAGSFHWWDQPDEGYYCLGNQPDVAVRHLEALRDAGVDFLVLDMTNHPNTQALNAEDFIMKSLYPLLEAARDVPNAPRLVPWVPFAADSDTTAAERARVCSSNRSKKACREIRNAQPMYQHITNLLQNEYPELMFEYDGKPLLLETANDRKYPRAQSDVVRAALENAWTVRRMWGLSRTNDQWQFLTTCSNALEFYNSRGWSTEGCNQPVNAGEQISVTPAYQYTYISEQFAVNERSYAGFTGGMPKFQGRTMAQQFRVAFEHRDSQPMVILTGWNEWIAQRFDLQGRVAFVDVYDDELNRDIEPGGASGDLYYYLMKDLITQYRNDQPFQFEDYFLTENSIFDARYYWESYPSLQAAFDKGDTAGLHNHWLTIGLAEGWRPSLAFDATFYSNSYSDLEVQGINTPAALLQHFIDFGFQEGRQGSAEFHAHSYLQRYPELAQRFGRNGYYKSFSYFRDVGQFAPSDHNARP
jgi:hypothetical protein